MWIPTIFIFIFVCSISYGSPDPFGDAMKKKMDERRLSFNQRELVNSHAECESKKKWYCQRECRFQFFEITGKCKVPSSDEKCFGMGIHYNYTYNNGVKHFPRELELLKRFPKCWSLLGPLLCASIYRPCSKNEYGEAEMKERGLIEMWEIFPVGMCYRAREECQFVIDEGLWPEILNCNNVAELAEERYPVAHTSEQEKRVFTDKANCTATNIDATITFPSEQCLWPLVKGAPDLAQTNIAKPLIDSCYLPCETPIAGFDWMLERFRKQNSIIAGITGVVFLLITV